MNDDHRPAPSPICAARFMPSPIRTAIPDFWCTRYLLATMNRAAGDVLLPVLLHLWPPQCHSGRRRRPCPIGQRRWLCLGSRQRARAKPDGGHARRSQVGASGLSAGRLQRQARGPASRSRDRRRPGLDEPGRRGTAPSRDAASGWLCPRGPKPVRPHRRDVSRGSGPVMTTRRLNPLRWPLTVKIPLVVVVLMVAVAIAISNVVLQPPGRGPGDASAGPGRFLSRRAIGGGAAEFASARYLGDIRRARSGARPLSSAADEICPGHADGWNCSCRLGSGPLSHRRAGAGPAGPTLPNRRRPGAGRGARARLGAPNLEAGSDRNRQHRGGVRHLQPSSGEARSVVDPCPRQCRPRRFVQPRRLCGRCGACFGPSPS